MQGKKQRDKTQKTKNPHGRRNGQGRVHKTTQSCPPVGKTKRGRQQKLGKRKNTHAGPWVFPPPSEKEKKWLETCPNLICPEVSDLCEPALTHTHREEYMMNNERLLVSSARVCLCFSKGLCSRVLEWCAVWESIYRF